ncbi:MAG TPA: hypothetical protein VMG81_06765 [Thermoplasmata archaeon]|nr:hypothetical protein [Thermoplasmata archaeon]
MPAARTSDPSSDSTPSAPARKVTGVPTALLVHDPDSRLLLRGLLRLQRYPVVFEGEHADDFERSPPTPGPKLLVVDGGPDEAEWADDLRAILARDVEYRIVLITADRSPEFAERARARGVRCVVIRPFAIREFVRALERASADDPAPEAPRALVAPARQA